MSAPVSNGDMLTGYTMGPMRRPATKKENDRETRIEAT